MKNAPLQHRLEYGFFVAAKAVLRALPHVAVRRVGRGLGLLGHRLLASQRRLVLANLQLTMPELGERQHRRIARDCFAHFGAYFCEFISLGRFSRQELLDRFEVVGEEHVRALEEEGRGYFLMTGHYGCFELGSWPIALREGPFTLVARPADNPYLEREMEHLRCRFGTRVVAKHGAARRLYAAAKKGERMGIVIDQRVPPEVALDLPFLGHPSWNSPLLAKLAIRTQVPVLPVRCVPAPGGRYRAIYGEPIPPMERGEGAEAALTRRYLEEIELAIREQPELWLWMHRKWKR